MFVPTSDRLTMDLSPYESIVAVVGSIITTGIVIWRLVRPAIKRVRHLHAALESIPQLVIDVTSIREQVHTNGGSSLKDVVDRIEIRQLHDSQVLGSFLASQNVAFFRTDTKGFIHDASRPLCKLLQRAEAELMGNGWMSWVHQKEREDVADEWNDAVTAGRDFDKHFDMYNDAGDVITVHVRAYLLLDLKRKPMGYFGTFTKVKPLG